MKTKIVNWIWVAALGMLWMAPSAWAHVSANVKLASTKESVQRLLPKGRLFVKEVDLGGSQLETLKSHDNWNTPARHFKFFVSRDENGKLQRVMTSMVEFTRHGPVVVAVALDPQGQVTGAILTDTQVEPLTWLEPLLRKNYMQAFQGKDSTMALTLDAKWQEGFSRISQDFARVIANAVKKSAQLFQVVFKTANSR